MLNLRVPNGFFPVYKDKKYSIFGHPFGIEISKIVFLLVHDFSPKISIELNFQEWWRVFFRSALCISVRPPSLPVVNFLVSIFFLLLFDRAFVLKLIVASSSLRRNQRHGTKVPLQYDCIRARHVALPKSKKRYHLNSSMRKTL